MTQEDEKSGTRRTEDINLEIERTRGAIQQDIKAIGEKFSAEEIKHQAKGVLADAKAEGATMIRETKDKAIDAVRSAGESVRAAAHDVAHEVGVRSRQVGDLTVDYARRGGRYARHAGEVTGDFVTTNAIPLSLIGLGVGWLALSMRRQRAIDRGDFAYRGYEYAGYEEDYPGADDFSVEGGEIRPRTRSRSHLMSDARGRVESAAHAARERAEGAAHAARERVDEVAGSARELAQRTRERVGAVADSAREQVSNLAQRASHGIDVARNRVTETASHLSERGVALSHEARERMHRAQLRTRDFADENPLAVGAIAIAAGVGVGLLLPATRHENRLMGETRDRLIGDARDLLREVRDTGSRVGDSARDAAREVRSAASESRVSH